MHRREIIRSLFFGDTSAKFCTKSEERGRAVMEDFQSNATNSFKSKWHLLQNQIFAQEDICVQVSQDWVVEDGRLKCMVRGMNKTVKVLTHQLSGGNQPGSVSLIFNFLSQPDMENDKDDYAGFRLGLQVRDDGERDPLKTINAGVTRNGYLLLGTKYSERKIEESKLTENIRLQLSIMPKASGGNFAKLKALDQSGNTLATMSTDTYDASAWQGDILLFSNFKINKYNRDQPTIAIGKFEIAGEKIICITNNS